MAVMGSVAQRMGSFLIFLLLLQTLDKILEPGEVGYGEQKFA